VPCMRTTCEFSLSVLVLSQLNGADGRAFPEFVIEFPYHSRAVSCIVSFHFAIVTNYFKNSAWPFYSGLTNPKIFRHETCPSCPQFPHLTGVPASSLYIFHVSTKSHSAPRVVSVTSSKFFLFLVHTVVCIGAGHSD
jgi:hypothetical protein